VREYRIPFVYIAKEMKYLLVAILLVITSGLALLDTALAQTPQPPDSMPPFMDRLAPPPTVYPPTQADEGAQVYYLVCMACHGDRGQGLTEEWRGALDPPDQNCWQSKCHASNHPREGFKLPEYIPAVISPGTVYRFANAQELHDYLQAEMPWQAPGILTDEEYWQLTAYLVHANGIDPGEAPLNEGTAVKVLLRPLPEDLQPEPAVSREQRWFWGAALVILAVAGVILLVKYINLLIKPRRPDDDFH
jgi:mono/diheme cytochrome c family protein